MTPEARAAACLSPAGVPPYRLSADTLPGVLAGRIADAIRAAECEAREACARQAEDFALRLGPATDVCAAADALTCRKVADVIRRG